MALISKHAFGKKENVEAAKTNGDVNAHDILFLDNREIGWIAKDGSTVMSTSRTQADIPVNGVTGLGIEDNATIPAGTSFDDLVKMLVQKPIPATYTKPILYLSNNGGQAAGNVEAGTSITPKIKAVFTKNDAGALSSISIKKGSTQVATGTTTPLEHTETVTIGDGSISYTATASYTAAAVKNNNLGQESKENWFDAGSINSSNQGSGKVATYTITGKRNAFYGTGIGAVPTVNSAFVRGLAGKTLGPAANTSLTINVAIGQQYIAFAYPADLRDVTSVTYVEANDGGMASSFTKTTINVADARGGENGLKSYKVYTYAMDVPAAAPMTFTVKI